MLVHIQAPGLTGKHLEVRDLVTQDKSIKTQSRFSQITFKLEGRLERDLVSNSALMLT